MPGSASPGASPDRPLVALAIAGDKLAFGALVRRHGAAVRMLLRRMGAQPAVADDVAQDAFIAAWRQIRQLRTDGSFEAWVKRIAARLYIKQWRKASRFQPLDDSWEEEAGGVEPSLSMDIDAALNSLTPPERLCVSLCIGAGYTHEELSEALPMPLGTVKSHVRRGLEKLKVRLGAAA